MKLYNTLTKSKIEIQANDEVGVYTCGPTVYLDPQIGNWRMFIFYDTLIRSLNYLGYETNHVINITDVGHLVSDEDEGEDKLHRQAKKEAKTAWDLAAFYTKRYLDDRQKLNMLKPDHMPKATETIEEQVAMIKAIESAGAAYIIDDGVYFDTSKFKNYGALANLSIEGQKAGARVEVNSQKKQPQDFALWKFSPKDEKRDMEWDSPWGKGFPGWHLECSAMAKKYLGDTIDIHAGGVDHLPVHHTNEIAQSETANGVEFARVWLHGEFLLVNGEKLSKSKGNSFTLEDITAKGYDPLAFRLLMLQAHYRSESNFTWDALDAAANRLQKLYALAARRWQTVESDSIEKDLKQISSSIREAIADDLNTPKVLELISRLQDLAENGINEESSEQFEKVLSEFDEVLGIKLLEKSKDITPEQYELIADREKARDEKDFSKSDSIRDNLLDQGIELQDKGSNTFWQRV